MNTSTRDPRGCGAPLEQRPGRRARRRLRAATALLTGSVWAGALSAQTMQRPAEPVPQRSVEHTLERALEPAAAKPWPASWRLSAETWQLPQQETMGMVGGNVLIESSAGLKIGVGSYGALRGQRGGFITLGLAAQGRWPIDPDWAAEAGVFVGAGGGRGGLQLAGGGLMLRSHLGLSHSLASWGHPSGRLGLGYAWVDFPSGTVRSRQPYVSYEHDFNSPLLPGWSAVGPAKSGSAPTEGVRPQTFSLTARHYRIPAGVVQDDGRPQHRTMELVGAQWTSAIDARSHLRLHAEGAMGGQSSGYMQILLGADYHWPLTRSSQLKVQAGAGPAGGGSVDTGGGLLVEAGVALQQQLGRQLALELGVSRVQAPSRSFKAHSVDLKLTHQFALPGPGAPAGESLEGRALRARALHQRYSGLSAQWRSEPALAVDNLGVAIDHFLSDPLADRSWFLTGQGLAAHSGRAGAYMIGLTGLGLHQRLGASAFAEVEALLGAAGGGGLATGNGLVVQTQASVGYRLRPDLVLIASLGQLQAPQGRLRSRVQGLALGWQFTGLTGPH